MKHYGLYDKSTTVFILVGITMMYVIVLGLCAFFVKQFVVDAIDTTGSVDLGVIPLLAIFLIPAFVVIPLLSRKSYALERYLLRCHFSEKGIYCFGLFWKPFWIPWDEIRTYGLQGYRYSYASLVFLFFSTKKEYYKNKNIAQISPNRIVFQLRDEILPPLLEFMPSDIRLRLEEAIEKEKTLYIQR